MGKHKFPLPLTNTTYTTQCHINYEAPVTGHFCDYETTYSKYHTYIPPKRNEFFVREKLENKYKEVSKLHFQAEVYKTTYHEDYKGEGHKDSDTASPPPLFCENTHYIVPQNEAFNKNPPPLKCDMLSEMKANYLPMYIPPIEDVNSILIDSCTKKEPLQVLPQPIRPDEKSIAKYLDPYLTTNKADYITFSEGAKRINDKIEVNIEPSTNPDDMYDTLLFKKKPKMSKIYVPNKTLECAKKSVYGNDYTKPDFTFDFEETVECDYTTVNSGAPWFTMCAPGMYCSEYCHIGSGYPIRSVVEIGKNTSKKIVHPHCSKKITDCQP